jgi:hypothetical protein
MVFSNTTIQLEFELQYCSPAPYTYLPLNSLRQLNMSQNIVVTV